MVNFTWDKIRRGSFKWRKRILNNKVSRCQFDLYVDFEDGKFKAWSNAGIASGYAYILLDIFNGAKDPKDITAESFNQLDMANLLSLNRQNGFYQMIGMMKERLWYM